MAPVAPLVISGAVEGPVDEAVASKLILEAGGVPGSFFGKKGKPFLKKRIAAWNHAAKFQPWFVLFDFDQAEHCIVEELSEWLEDREPWLCLRAAVRAIEAWLLADRSGIARFLSVAEVNVPLAPEALMNPKETMVNLARRSRKRAISADMVPRERSRRSVGPAYTSRMIEFTSEHWEISRAVEASPSLARALGCLDRLLKTAKISAGR